MYNYNALKPLQSQVLRHDENLLPVDVGSQDFCAFPDDEYTEVGVEKTQKIVSSRDNVARCVDVKDVIDTVLLTSTN